VTHTTANAVAKRVAQTVPDAERCRKASREGTSRVFEAIGGDKPVLLYWQRILGCKPVSLHRSARGNMH